VLKTHPRFLSGVGANRLLFYLITKKFLWKYMWPWQKEFCSYYG